MVHSYSWVVHLLHHKPVISVKLGTPFSLMFNIRLKLSVDENIFKCIASILVYLWFENDFVHFPIYIYTSNKFGGIQSFLPHLPLLSRFMWFRLWKIPKWTEVSDQCPQYVLLRVHNLTYKMVNKVLDRIINSQLSAEWKSLIFFLSLFLTSGYVKLTYWQWLLQYFQTKFVYTKQNNITQR